MFSKTRFPLTAIAASFVFLSPGVFGADDTTLEMKAAMVDIESEVHARESARKMAGLAVEEAEIALDLVELHLAQATKAGAEHDLARLTLEKKRALLHISMRKVEADVAHVRLNQAKAKWGYLQQSPASKSPLKGPVSIEYLKDLDLYVTRGRKEDVAKVAGLISELNEKKKAGEAKNAVVSDQAKDLLKKRVEILKQLADATQQQYSVGVTAYQEVLQANDLLARAELDLATGKSQRVALREKRCAILKDIEALATARHQSASGGITAVLAAKAARLKAEAELLEEKASGK